MAEEGVGALELRPQLAEAIRDGILERRRKGLAEAALAPRQAHGSHLEAREPRRPRAVQPRARARVRKTEEPGRNGARPRKRAHRPRPHPCLEAFVNPSLPPRPPAGAG